MMFTVVAAAAVRASLSIAGKDRTNGMECSSGVDNAVASVAVRPRRPAPLTYARWLF